MNKSELLKETSKFDNKVFGFIEWDSNDADYISRRLLFERDKFFNDELLLKVLAFITNKCDEYACQRIVRYGYHIGDEYIPDDYEELHQKLLEIMDHYSLIVYSENGRCHSVEKLELYYLDNGKIYTVDLSSLKDGWDKMTYEEIIKSILELYKEDDEV